MFEPVSEDMDVLQLAISLPEVEPIVSNGVFIPLDGITNSPVLNSDLDAFLSQVYSQCSVES